MYVKAIRLDKTEELHLSILSLMFPDERCSTRVNFVELAKQLNASGIKVSEEVVRYNVTKKLKKLGYIRECGDGYEPTEKVLFLKKKSG